MFRKFDEFDETNEAFLDGKVPDPFSVTLLSDSLFQDVRVAEGFPFILASHIIVTSSTDASINPPQVVLENVWCFWGHRCGDFPAALRLASENGLHSHWPA